MEGRRGLPKSVNEAEHFWTKPFLHWQEIIPCEFIFKLLTSGCVLLTTFSRLYSQIIPHMGNAARNSHVEEHCTMYLTPAFLKMMLVPSAKHLRKQMWFQQTWNKRTHRIFHFPKKHTTGIWFYRLQVQTSSLKLSLKLMYPQFILCLAMVKIFNAMNSQERSEISICPVIWKQRSISITLSGSTQMPSIRAF